MTGEWTIQQVARLAGTTSRTLRHYGEEPMAETMFDGFDHTAHREEVVERWGADTYARSDAWWRGMPADEKKEWQETSARLASDWADAAGRGIRPDSPEAQALAARHVAWLRGIPGTPASPRTTAAVRVRPSCGMRSAITSKTDPPPERDEAPST